jgi:hypothetical protein
VSGGGAHSHIDVAEQSEWVGTAGHYLPVYMMYCSNCGFVALHMKHVLERRDLSEAKESEYGGP